ncbi:MAG: hypothetical protein WB780_02665, partial [Candidatus Acidiferrales bacterium]
MKCATHAEVDTTGYCRNCGKAMCPECTRDVRGALYCEECLARIVGVPAAQGSGQPIPPPLPKSDSNPGLALLLGFIPGLGAVYNGEYVKALIHVVIFGGLIAVHNSIMNADDVNAGYMVFIHVAIACFYFYMPIDAYRVAKARRTGSAPPEAIFETPGHAPVGAFVLILFGVLFLLANFGLLREDW